MDEIKEPTLCSVCKTAVAAFDGFILFVFFVFFVSVLIVFSEKKDDAFFNTAPDADDDILCSYQTFLVLACYPRVFSSARVTNREFCVTTTERNEMRRDDYI